MTPGPMQGAGPHYARGMTQAFVDETPVYGFKKKRKKRKKKK
jgi:hypothetical protein